MKGVIIHGTLLLVMLLVGYQTWTRDKTVKPSVGQVVVWDQNLNDLTAVVYEDTKKTVRIDRKSDADGSFWWGQESKTTKKPKPPAPTPDAGVADAGVLADGGAAKPAPAAAADAGAKPAVAAADAGPKAVDGGVSDGGVPADAGAVDAGTPPEPEYETVTTTREFPIGKTGDELLPKLVALRAMKALGPLDDAAKTEYELTDTDRTLSFVFKSGTRTFVVGGDVYGGTDRYVMDADSGQGYVLAGTLVKPMTDGESALKPTDLRGFPVDDVATVKIDAGGKQRTVARITTEGEGKSVKTWGDAATGKADQTMANFVDSVEKLRPSKYDPEVTVASLTAVTKLTYVDAKGKALGSIALYKRDTTPATDATTAEPPAPTTEYYVVTERTRIPGLVAKSVAGNIEQDVAALFPAP